MDSEMCTDRFLLSALFFIHNKFAPPYTECTSPVPVENVRPPFLWRMTRCTGWPERVIIITKEARKTKRNLKVNGIKQKLTDYTPHPHAPTPAKEMK